MPAGCRPSVAAFLLLQRTASGAKPAAEETALDDIVGGDNVPCEYRVVYKSPVTLCACPKPVLAKDRFPFENHFRSHVPIEAAHRSLSSAGELYSSATNPSATRRTLPASPALLLSQRTVDFRSCRSCPVIFCVRSRDKNSAVLAPGPSSRTKISSALPFGVTDLPM
eukprot:COSAG02_NODE_35_length_49339_cov_20.375102_10_plen_167_part_00